MRVTYIGHSGFSVELDHFVLLFDYYQGTLPDFPRGKQLIIFASHKHHDHFNPKIFSLADANPGAVYLLSREIRIPARGMEKGEVHYLGRRAMYDYTFQGHRISVVTLRSTDIGTAFLVRADGKLIYHGGDLNWWAWKGAAKSSLSSMAARYQDEIHYLEEQEPKKHHVDVAFVPLDPRLEEYTPLGMDYFLRHMDPDYVFPMHFWEKYEIIREYKEREESQEWKDKIVEIERQGQEFLLP